MSKISVIIPVYNVDKYLEKCLKTVTEQTFKDIEIICVNDGSTDNSAAILEKYAKSDSRIKVINKQNGGLSSAWNTGLNNVTSEYVTFVDGDDYIEPDMLELAYSAMINNDTDYVCWGANIIATSDILNIKSQKKYHKIRYCGLQKVDNNLIRKTVVTVWSKLYKTSIIKSNEIYFPTKSGHDDNAFWLMYAPYTKNGYYIPKYLYNYIQRKNSIMDLRRKERTEKIFDNIQLIPPLINYYNTHNLTEKHYDLLITNIKKLFLNDFKFKKGKYKKEVLEKCSKDLNSIKLNELYRSEFINAIRKQDIKYLENSYTCKPAEKLFSIKNQSEYIAICIFGLKITIKHKPKIYRETISTNEKILNLEINQILDSGLFDSEYYIKTNPELKLKKREAAKHYLTKGWKTGKNPCAEFDGTNYIKRYKKIKYNPLLYFLNEGRYDYKDAFLYNKYRYDKNSIKNYLEYKKTRTSDKVVYTCITNDYDDLKEIEGYTYINSDWDYVCFTDNEELIKQKQTGIWEIRPLKFNGLDNTRNSRWHKINPHIVLPEYQQSLFIDANINILTGKIFKIIEQNTKDLMLAEHANTICLYKEFEWIFRANIDKPEIMNSYYNLIKTEGFPQNYGLPENNIIYRKHNKAEIISIMNDWWYMLEHYSRRDQLSLPYVLWKHNIKCENVICFPNTRIDYKNFCTFVHKGRR